MSKITTFNRIVVYQRRNAWVCDLGAGSVLTPRFRERQRRFDTAAGTRKTIGRERRLVIPVYDEDKISHLKVMAKEGCELRAIAIGHDSHIYWGLDSEFNFVPFGDGPASVSGYQIEMENDLYLGSIYQGKDLIASYPWECETAALEDATYYLPGPSGWRGDRWVVASGDTVDEFGLFIGSGSPKLTLFFPMQGLNFRLSGTWTGNMKTLDHSGATLTTTTKATAGTDETGTIDDGTWKIEINVTTASTRPQLLVDSAGSLASDRVGECVDCSDTTAEATTTPAWSS